VGDHDSAGHAGQYGDEDEPIIQAEANFADNLESQPQEDKEARQHAEDGRDVVGQLRLVPDRGLAHCLCDILGDCKQRERYL